MDDADDEEEIICITRKSRESFEMIHRKGRNTVDCVFVFSMQ
jgi:hypothetical protein